MSARGRRKARAPRRDAWWEAAWLRGLLLLVLGVYLAFSLTGETGPWWRALGGGETGELLPDGIGHPGGPVGALLTLFLRVLFGAAWAWTVPALLAVAGVRLLARRPALPRPLLWRLLPLWLVTAAWIAQPGGLLADDAGAAWGGICGLGIARGFRHLFGPVGMRIFLTFLLLAVLAIVLRPWWAPLAGRWTAPRPPRWWSWRPRRGPAGLLRGLGAGLRGWLRRDRDAGEPLAHVTVEEEAPAWSDPARRLHGLPSPGQTREISVETGAGGVAAPRPSPGPAATTREAAQEVAPPLTGPVSLPPLSLLRDTDPDVPRTTPEQLNAAADLLEATLRSFGVEGEVKDVRPGPVVTTFEYQPASGIKVSQIVQREDDLALAMRARSIRMEAPIPGKAAVGIEIPNPVPQIVRLKEVLEEAHLDPRSPLMVGLGKDVVGKPVTLDIAKLPHLLVAGSTGTGKSVCLNSIICSLLLRNDPSRVRLVLVDPKMLEMSVYNGIPHLLLPVVTDPKEALRALQWMVAQMDLRYRQLARVGVRNIEGYNEKVARGELKDEAGGVLADPMPYYVTIVDELADLMVQLGQDIEQPITRLAAKARAVGLNLILATQRPSVDVITGVIKANIPCRLAFRVIQRNDSRTILDMNGAEQLLGNGDMLYLQPGRAMPVRVQGSFLEIEECKAVVDHWLQYQDSTEMISLETRDAGEGDYTGEDDLFEEAKRIVVIHQSGSTSLLQRRLRVGYTRAGRLIDMLEEAGVVGPFTGSKAREVLMKPEDLDDGPGADGAEA